MPFYDYKCKDCGISVEITDLSPPLCPNGHGLMARQFTPPIIVSSTSQTKAQRAHERGYYREQEEKASKEVKRKEHNKNIKRKMLKRYGSADFHNRHGIGADGLAKSARKIEAMK